MNGGTDWSTMRVRHKPGAAVERLGAAHWRLVIPAGPPDDFRIAQLDDYSRLYRRHLRWRPPAHLAVRARASSRGLAGTWGFGWWNDPFSLGLGKGATKGRLPALPQTAWFFHASPPNHLTLRDDLPHDGMLAAAFRSPAVPSELLTLGAPLLPLLALPPAARLLRRLARRLITEDGRRLDLDPTAWHDYRLDWWPDGLRLSVDGEVCLETNVSPRAPMGLVLWIDNQYAAYPPTGRVRQGALATPEPAWLEVILG
ncbi:MAG: hypothetical protein GX649_14245 [Chloroflexi bacterium]|nr:hypothetical protein [Chloroflexota bacterium]